MMIWGNGGMGGWATTLMGLGNLVFWGLLITGIVLLVRRPGRDTAATSSTAAAPTPQQVLADRFARGEIGEEEYTRRLRILDDTRPHHPGG